MSPPAPAFRFTGEQWDYELHPAGMVQLRARAYNPELGRFLQRDPLAGSTADPQSLNRFGYAQNNPVNLVDPSGLAPHKSVSLSNCLTIPTPLGPPIRICLPSSSSGDEAQTQMQTQPPCPATPTNVLVGYVSGSGSVPHRIQYRTPSTDRGSQACHVNVQIPMSGSSASYINWHIYHAGGTFSGVDTGTWLPSIYAAGGIRGTSPADTALDVGVDFEQRVAQNLGTLAPGDHSVIMSLVFGVAEALSQLRAFSP